MKERPIIFNAAAVKAILAGAKTQTRRPCKTQPPLYGDDVRSAPCGLPGCYSFSNGEKKSLRNYPMKSPFGVPGDRLWCISMHDIPGYEGKYAAGDDGHIYRIQNGIYRGPLKEAKSNTGYMRISLGGGKTQKSFCVHSLVCSAFYKKESSGLVVRHLDSDRTNNLPENLDWGTKEQNWIDRKVCGAGVRGLHHNAKLTQEKADAIRIDKRSDWTLAKEYKVSSKTIHHVRSGRTWTTPDPCPPNMPRWASRITLEIVSVRVERVNEISEEDAISEGAVEWWNAMTRIEQENIYSGGRGPCAMFNCLWDSIYGKTYPWESSPWVWVYSFRRLP